MTHLKYQSSSYSTVRELMLQKCNTDLIGSTTRNEFLITYEGGPIPSGAIKDPAYTDLQRKMSEDK